LGSRTIPPLDGDADNDDCDEVAWLGEVVVVLARRGATSDIPPGNNGDGSYEATPFAPLGWLLAPIDIYAGGARTCVTAADCAWTVPRWRKNGDVDAR
jgi:hypothetical protein